MKDFDEDIFTQRGAPIPWSRGTERPVARAPEHSCDCHFHIYDSRFPFVEGAGLKPGDAAVADYRRVMERLGVSRCVLVQPSSYGTDNSLLVKSLGELGDCARGVAVVNDRVSDSELQVLHDAGVRGLRFNLVQEGTTTYGMIEPLAHRVAGMGWHVQVNALGDELLKRGKLWSNLPVPVVFDHLAQIPEPDPLRHAAYAMVRELLVNEKAYVKLSGAYIATQVGAEGDYRDRFSLVRAYAEAAPDRLVFGSDWPHPTEHAKAAGVPNDATLFDLMVRAVPDRDALNKILVCNPRKLYFS